MPEALLDDLEWLLLLSFPNGGSTAIARTLLTAAGTIALTPNAEGQWLVPAMSAPRARWDSNTPLDYNDIRARWMEAARHAAVTAGPVRGSQLVIEKSPPNMCRYHAIVSMLQGMKSHVVVMTRDPFATCASWHSSYTPEVVERDWGWPGERPTGEAGYFRALGEIWLKRAEYLDAAREDAVDWIRYEDISDRPSDVISALAHRIPRLRSVKPDAPIKVKDYPVQKLRNMNREQISELSDQHVESISVALKQKPELVARFGYDVRLSRET
jgi:hypothetical protein